MSNQLLGQPVIVSEAAADNEVALVRVERREKLPETPEELYALGLKAGRDGLEIHVSREGFRRIKDVADRMLYPNTADAGSEKPNV